MAAVAEHKPFLKGGDQDITPGEAYYIVNVNHEKLLDTHGKGVWVWNHDGRSVLRCVTSNTSEKAGNLRWKVVLCPHQDGVFYLYNLGQNAVLDSHGSGVQVWNNGGKSIARIIEGNTSEKAGNVRWHFVPCPHQPGTFYIVNARHRAFLDTHGTNVTVWNNRGKSEAEIIEGNTSENAGNIRWCFINVRKQDRFGTAMEMFGMKTQRPPNLCRLRSTVEHHPLPEDVAAEVAQSADECRAMGIDRPGCAYLRAYTKETLYRRLNQALLHDDASELRVLGQLVIGLMDAIRTRSQETQLTGTVWRGMQMDDTTAYHPGQKFLWPNFVSTSKDRTQAFAANTIFEIDLAGEGVTYAVEVAEESEFPKEAEVLLYPYTGFEVTGKSCLEGGQTLIQLRTLDTLHIEMGSEAAIRRRGSS